MAGTMRAQGAESTADTTVVEPTVEPAEATSHAIFARVPTRIRVNTGVELVPLHAAAPPTTLSVPHGGPPLAISMHMHMCILVARNMVGTCNVGTVMQPERQHWTG